MERTSTEGARMTQSQARQMLGASVVWMGGMDERIYDARLDKIGHHGVCTVSYRLTGSPERFTTYKSYSVLEIQRTYGRSLP